MAARPRLEKGLKAELALGGKVAIITGARRGIGAAEARALAHAGAQVVVCDLQTDELTAIRDEINQLGGDCLALQCDVTDADQVAHVVDQTTARFGRIDVLINNAQSGLEPVAWGDMTDELVISTFMSGPMGTWHFMRACFPHMKAQGSGRIINTASAASRGGTHNFGHYAMAKGAITSLTYAAATDWGKYGITVNVIFPAVATEMLRTWLAGEPDKRKSIEAGIPLRRLGEASTDLAPVVVFLASDASQYLTGHPFFIDGGGSQAPR